MTKRSIFTLAAATALMQATPALAHTGLGAIHGVAEGLAHPFLGVDHVLAMLTVGLLAAHIGGRALLLVPLAFVAMMSLGAAVGMAGFDMAGVDVLIAVSVVVLGGLVALQIALPARVAAALAGGFALFHGFAHGAEMPVDTSGLAYAAGFIAATATLHATGIVLGLGLSRLATGATLTRLSGSAIALAGVALLTGMIQA